MHVSFFLPTAFPPFHFLWKSMQKKIYIYPGVRIINNSNRVSSHSLRDTTHLCNLDELNKTLSFWLWSRLCDIQVVTLTTYIVIRRLWASWDTGKAWLIHCVSQPVGGNVKTWPPHFPGFFPRCPWPSPCFPQDYRISEFPSSDAFHFSPRFLTSAHLKYRQLTLSRLAKF